MTTKDKIKGQFLSGQILTSCSAAEQFVTADLRKIVSDLRKEKIDIVDEWVKSGTGKRYKKYFIKQNQQLQLL